MYVRLCGSLCTLASSRLLLALPSPRFALCSMNSGQFFARAALINTVFDNEHTFFLQRYLTRACVVSVCWLCLLVYLVVSSSENAALRIWVSRIFVAFIHTYIFFVFILVFCWNCSVHMWQPWFLVAYVQLYLWRYQFNVLNSLCGSNRIFECVLLDIFLLFYCLLEVFSILVVGNALSKQ